MLMGRKANLYLTNIILSCAAMILSIVAVLGYFASVTDPSITWYFSVISLVLAPILIVNLIFLIYFAVRRKWLIMLFPIVALGLNHSYITAVFQIKFSSPEETTNSIKIATFNVHAFSENRNIENEVRNIAEFLYEERIDIVCFQEFMYNKKLGVEDISRIFSFLPYHTEIKFNTYSDLIVAIYSRFPIKAHKIVPFLDSNNRCLWADIDIDGKMVRIVNAHLQTTNVNQSRKEFSVISNNTISKEGKEAINTFTYRLKDNNIKRAQQSGIVEKLFHDTSYPTLVCGDFNDTPSSYTYNNLIRAGLKDGFRDAGSGYMYTYKKLMYLLRIDYILYSKGIEPINYYSPSTDFSDHKPVIFEFTIK